MEDNIKNSKQPSMDKLIIIFLELNTTKEIHMDFQKNYTKKNSLLEYNQIVYGIIQELEEWKNKLEGVKVVEKGKYFYFILIEYILEKHLEEEWKVCMQEQADKSIEDLKEDKVH